MSEDRLSHVDFSGAEFSAVAEPVDAPLFMTLPINGLATTSCRGDGFMVAIMGDGRCAIVAAGLGGGAAYHTVLDAAALRTMASVALRTADLLDNGKGKQ